MDIRHVRTFVTVAESGTVSAAALRLRVAQPALSRQITHLEQDLGVRLFHRVGRRLVLSGEGEQLLDECRGILGAVHSLQERSQRLRAGDGGVLKIAATPQSIDGVFASFLHRFAERRPNVRVRLTEAVGNDLVTMLERGEVQLTVSLVQPTQVDSPYFNCYKLAPLEFLAAFPKRVAGDIGSDVDIARVAAFPLLLPDRSFYVRTTFDAACRLAGVKTNVFLESRAPHTLLAMAEAGHGVAVVPSVLPTGRYRLRIARITHRRRPLRETYAVLWDKRRALLPYAADFCDALAAHMRHGFPLT